MLSGIYSAHPTVAEMSPFRQVRVSVSTYCSVCFCICFRQLPLWNVESTSSVLQCVAVCCSVLQCVAACCSVLQCVAVCCSVLQRVAVCCGVLQCVAVCCIIYFHSVFHTPGTHQIRNSNSSVQIQITQNFYQNSHCEMPKNLNFSIWWSSGV